MNLVRLSTVFLVGVFFLHPRLGYAQTYHFKNFSSDDGYTGVGFPTFVQDSLGFLWIKAANGLYRYDGYGFRAYHHDPMDSLWTHFNNWGIPSIDPSGNLWIQDSRLRMFNRDLDDFITYSPRYSQGGGIVTTFFEKDKETIWLGMWNQGLVSLNLKTNKTIEYSNNENPIATIVDRGPYFLLGTQRGLWKFDKESKQFIWPKCSKADSLVFTKGIYKIFVSEDHYWMYVAEPLHHLLVKVDTNFLVLKILDMSDSFKKFDHSTSYSDVAIESIDRDQNGVFWIASRGLGLFRFDPADNKIDNIRNDPDDAYSLPSDQLVSVMVDRDQNVWVASIDKGISQLKKQSLYFYNYLRGSTVTSAGFLPAGKGGYLIATTEVKGIWTSPISTNSLASINFQYFDMRPNVVGFENLQTMYVGESTVWFGSFTEGVIGLPINIRTGMMEHGPPLVLQHGPDPNKYNPNAITNNRVLSLYEDAANNLWIGTAQGNGLNKVVLSIPYGKNGSVVHFRHDEGDSTSIAFSPYIFSLYPENDFSFWIGITPGLELYNSGHFEHVDKKIHTYFVGKARDGTILLGSDGLYEGRKEGGHYRFAKVDLLGNSLVNSVEEDKLGRLWVATLDGLFCYNRTEKTILHFKEKDGLASSRARVMQMPDGTMAVSTPNGISLFDPMSLVISQTKLKPVLLLLKVNNKPVDANSKGSDKDDLVLPHDISGLQELVLDYQHNIFSLEFAALELTAPEKNLYAYKLEGFNKEWVYTDAKNRMATYTNLDPGHYTFKVKASSRDGVWSDHETTLKIHVLPPPWRTWWAYTGYSFMIAGLLLLARKSVVQRERLKSNLKLAKVEQEREHFELEKAKEVDKVKSAFFTNISHEFRTPLTLIKGPVATLLEEYANNPRTKEQLKLVERNSDLLLKLINQLLDLAKLESGTLTVDKTEGDMNSFLLAIANSFSSMALQKNIGLTIEPPSSRYLALFDKDKLETILINLVNNAIKFTPPGGNVNVRFLWETLTQNSNRLTISVADTGIGIPADQQTKIFERFHQVNEAHKEVGTGIGLSLVKELVSLMEGTLTLKSELGKGSEFVIVLPVEIVRALSEGEVTVRAMDAPEIALQEKFLVKESENETGDDVKARLLVVEDNDDLRSFIISSLGGEFHFIEARDGREGMEKAFEEVPDLIISDVMMPEMDGITMTKKIKKDTRTSHIPLILLTAKTSEESKLSGLETGADDYLTKPFNRNELLLKVRNRIALQVKLREKIRLELLKDSPKVEVQSADEKFLIKVKEAILKRMDDEQLGVESLAEEIGLSRSQLLRKITALTGVSVNELIRTFRLQKAAHLLEQKWGPVAQVAYEVGFSNLSYFSKVFKEQYGVLPSEYKVKVV